MAIHTAPNPAMRLRDDEWQTLAEDYHWHIKIAPRVFLPDPLGGFAVNPVLPAAAAESLREAARFVGRCG